jgi:phosphate transport system permease protein
MADQVATQVTAAAGVATVPHDPPFDLSGMRSRKASERAIGIVLFICGSLSILTTIGIVLVLAVEAVQFFRLVSVWEFATGTVWTALFHRENRPGEFGIWPLITGTLMISLIAMVVALPLGLMSAIYLSEYAPERARAVLKPTLELLAGVPTIVYGFFALSFITPDVIKRFFPGVGAFNALAAGIAVGILVLPLIASLSEDAMRSVPRALREGAYALGATKLEVATRIVLPAALSGIVASFILAISRAAGETMIVVLAAGSKPQLGFNVLDQAQTMTAYIVAVVGGDPPYGGTIYRSMFAVGTTLFILTLLLNIASQWLVRRFREVYE